MTDTRSAARLSKIRLESARGRGAAPEAGALAYEIVAPLDATNHISIEGWKARRGLCFVHRLEHGRTIGRGQLQHHAGGAGGGTWTFDYEPGGEVDQEAGWHFESHAFVPGEYVSIRDADGTLLTFKIASVGAA